MRTCHSLADRLTRFLGVVLMLTSGAATMMGVAQGAATAWDDASARSDRSLAADGPAMLQDAIDRDGECEPEWSPMGTGMNELVHVLTDFDDGSGLAIYAGGSFTFAGGRLVNRITRWDGAAWSPLGSGMNGTVWALTVFDDGSGPALYAGGTFITAGGHTVNRIARWDGSDWSSLGTGMNGSVQSLAVFDDGSGPALYAGGTFTTAGGQIVNRIARWDGTTWSALGSGTSVGSVEALTVFDDGSGPALYAGGNFIRAGGETVNRIARWDGSEWSPMGSGMNNWVEALAVFDDGSGSALYAAGFFSTAGGQTVNRIARWDGTAWSPLESGMSDWVFALAVFDDGSGPALYAGGDFTSSAVGQVLNRIARWDGTVWSSLESGTNGSVRALMVFDGGFGPALYNGGGFSTAGGQAANRIAKWQGCPTASACPPDLNADALLNFFDIATFLNLYQAQDPIADWNSDGLFNFFDLASYLNAFNAGCP